MKTMFDSIVRVDRSTPPILPDGWKKKVMHPELAMTGPSKFDASQLDLWVHSILTKRET
ncbi:MAG: hypothetical protein V1704_02125 [Candidatus Vogelbacteria bacterium]